MLNKTKKTSFLIIISSSMYLYSNRSFSHDVTAAMFVYKTMNRRPCLCTKKNPVGVGFFSHVKTFFYPKQFANLLTTWLKTIYRSWATTNHSLACVAFTSLYKYQYFIVVVAGLFKSSKAFTSHFVFERETMRYSPKMVRYKIEMSWFRTWMKRFRTHVT